MDPDQTAPIMFVGKASKTLPQTTKATTFVVIGVLGVKPLDRLEIRCSLKKHKNSQVSIDIQKKNQRKIANIFLAIIFSICFGCSKEPSQ